MQSDFSSVEKWLRMTQIEYIYFDITNLTKSVIYIISIISTKFIKIKKTKSYIFLDNNLQTLTRIFQKRSLHFDFGYT